MSAIEGKADRAVMFVLTPNLARSLEHDCALGDLIAVASPDYSR